MRLTHRPSTVATLSVALGLAACRSNAPSQSVDLHTHARLALTSVGQRVSSAQSIEGEHARAPLSQDRLCLSDEHGPCEILLRPGADGLELVMLEGEGAHVLATGVRPFAMGEEPNGMDDNGNGLIDEAGFSVVHDGSRLWLGLSLARTEGSEEHVAHAEERVEVPR